MNSAKCAEIVKMLFFFTVVEIYLCFVTFTSPFATKCIKILIKFCFYDFSLAWGFLFEYGPIKMHSVFQWFHRATSSDANLWRMLTSNAVCDLTNALNTNITRNRWNSECIFRIKVCLTQQLCNTKKKRKSFVSPGSNTRVLPPHIWKNADFHTRCVCLCEEKLHCFQKP